MLVRIAYSYGLQDSKVFPWAVRQTRHRLGW